MGEELAETRLAVDAKRAELRQTAAQLRDALDIRQRFRENPALFIGVGAAALFVIAGGPGRVARGVRRQLFPTNPEKAYDSLPKPMQAWVDHMAGAVGPRAGEARQTLAEELQRWRQDPRRNAKISRKLAKQIAEGPPGPQRVVWSAFEVASSIVVAALARKAVERFLSGEPPSGIPALDAAGTAGGAAKPEPKHAKDDITKPRAKREAAAQYSSLSSRGG
ncbi:MAG TPA: hypothetical protein VFW95_12520 [Candidatus Limnocylindria bacterium]|nr:hypothetical protein [Candidatus Limnocylindria bacterium]